MRFLSLKSADNLVEYKTNYHYQIQEFIYGLLEKSSQFSQLHNKKVLTLSWSVLATTGNASDDMYAAEVENATTYRYANVSKST
jgi:CRISPR/Cas system endoribonuclease Cas6 (RAMP superfamily)